MHQQKAFHSGLVRNHCLSYIARFKDKNVYFYPTEGKVAKLTLLKVEAIPKFYWKSSTETAMFEA